MKKVLPLLVLAIGICAGTTFATITTVNPNALIWCDQDDSAYLGNPGNFYDAYVEAEPGDTIVAFVEVNYPAVGWHPLRRFVSGVWWDAAVLDRPETNYDYTRPLFNEGGGEYGTTTKGEYWAAEVASTYGGANYQYVDLWYQPMYSYDMRHVGWAFTVREDAPLGITTVGQRLVGDSYYGWGGVWELRSESDDAFALKINVVPEPATLSLLAIGGLAGLRRLRRRR